jgi:diguanylate cyclase (GGDEF)-like protein
MKTVLIVEDERSIRANIARMLHYAGFQAIEAENGNVGVQLAKAYLPDLIICDIMMPELDGYGVFESLNQDPETAIIPFIFLSAKADRSDIRQGMNLGADDYLTKPFTSEELIQAVSARLNKQASVTQPYITEMRRASDSLSQMAYRDPLTNLPNRILLRHRLHEALVQAKKRRLSLAVLCVNLVRFRTINTTLGQSVGDELLRRVAERLQALNQPSNYTVARLSGDEFCIVIPQIDSLHEVEQFAQLLLCSLHQPYKLVDQHLTLQATVGIAVYPEHGDNPDQLMVRADYARRWQRREAGSGACVYAPDMSQADDQWRKLEAGLQTALANQEFSLQYQPQINLISGRLIGMEALLRWNHPEYGNIPPDQFIPVAEETGLITEISSWVIRTACEQAKGWQSQTVIPLKISVNLSARQFSQPDLLSMISDILMAVNLEPGLLVLEITETCLMENLDSACTILQELKALGVGISLDDFGTGYSSLSYLRQFPIDMLKIDRSFVSRVPTDSHDSAITSAIVAMAQSLNLKVIAEGVETQEQAAFLKKQGCYAIQGYLCSRPLTEEALSSFIASYGQ